MMLDRDVELTARYLKSITYELPDKKKETKSTAPFLIQVMTNRLKYANTPIICTIEFADWTLIKPVTIEHKLIFSKTENIFCEKIDSGTNIWDLLNPISATAAD